MRIRIKENGSHRHDFFFTLSASKHNIYCDLLLMAPEELRA